MPPVSPRTMRQENHARLRALPEETADQPNGERREIFRDKNERGYRTRPEPGSRLCTL